MYLRRLRSVMDEFLNGWVDHEFTKNFNYIAAAANKDNAKWNAGAPALGYKCAPSACIVFGHAGFLMQSA